MASQQAYLKPGPGKPTQARRPPPLFPTWLARPYPHDPGQTLPAHDNGPRQPRRLEEPARALRPARSIRLKHPYARLNQCCWVARIGAADRFSSSAATARLLALRHNCEPINRRVLGANRKSALTEANSRLDQFTARPAQPDLARQELCWNRRRRNDRWCCRGAASPPEGALPVSPSTWCRRLAPPVPLQAEYGAAMRMRPVCAST